MATVGGGCQNAIRTKIAAYGAIILQNMNAILNIYDDGYCPLTTLHTLSTFHNIPDNVPLETNMLEYVQLSKKDHLQQRYFYNH